ncbi:uncharacterized protein SPAPADRAFT_63136 [Spathaspora passalidarum NRRL Y-27907]|uniref:DNA repair and recombination protein RAD52 n=1 Tax=Spathaspora passalidarum (strain NRRL Y-27907 / 11-Y1) TaxID=619300 RepID=G3ATR5_SPAPN|nr:uncharacterized protein SPAPADRAFT_63136 [Spathaspora passalidarum NRRL Y-27907]EGW30291.1 hypothetical protein SPAPADRAFT_63136 [Spathaspora passalidarum NRRL Y-27907]
MFPRPAPPPAKPPAVRTFKPTPYTQHEQTRIQTQLNKVLGPEYVSFRPGGNGTKVSYIEGWKALNLANEIFGFNGWNSELISTQVDYFDTHGNTGRFSMGLSVVVRVTVKDGTYHEDFGYGYIDNAKSKAMAFEKCKKEAFTDGVKRCLRCFGNVLGNCLYDKTIVAKMQKVKLPPAELQDDNFHRDPLLVERERKKGIIEKQHQEEAVNENKQQQQPPSHQPQQQQQQQQQQPQQPQNRYQPPHPQYNQQVVKPVVKPSPTQQPAPKLPPPQPVPGKQQPQQPPQQQFVTPKSPSKVIDHNPQLDDFDDSFLFSDDMDEDSPPLNSTTNTTAPDSAASALFVSAKGANLLQQSPNPTTTNLPHFDPKFVSPNIRRTVDPTKSVPVKRSDVSSNGASQNHLRGGRSFSPLHGGVGGKRVGMPQGVVQNKRLHLDGTETASTTPPTVPVVPAPSAPPPT